MKPDPEAELEEPFIIRPTSETIIWNSYKNWIHSWRDLPILINQWANVMRWELRPRLFLRTSEFFWQEGHTAHATSEEAEQESLTILEIYRKFAEEWMCVPVVRGMKSEGEKFAGADHTYTIETMTQDLRAIQAGTSHHLGQNFAKAFDVKFQTAEGTEEFVWATSWGVSTRLIGTLIMAHSDDKGFICPPKLAPIQVIIVPIGRKDDWDRVLIASEQMAEKIKATLWEGSEIRVRIDKRDRESPGFKFNDWELKGACLRLELGPRDLDAGQCVLARRDTSEKETTTIEAVIQNIPIALQAMHCNLFERALQLREDNTKRIDTWEDFQACFDVEGGGGFVLAHWDGTSETEDAINAETKATIRCIPLEPLMASDNEPGFCVKTGKLSARRVLFAKAY